MGVGFGLAVYEQPGKVLIVQSFTISGRHSIRNAWLILSKRAKQGCCRAGIEARVNWGCAGLALASCREGKDGRGRWGAVAAPSGSLVTEVGKGGGSRLVGSGFVLDRDADLSPSPPG